MWRQGSAAGAVVGGWPYAARHGGVLLRVQAAGETRGVKTTTVAQSTAT
jgi:hypothetical protein